MKKIISISLLLLLISVSGKAQEAPEKSNLILIKTSDNIDESFKNIGRILINEGYELETADKNFYVITTKVTQKKYGFMGGGSLELKFNVEFDEAAWRTAQIAYDMKFDGTPIFYSWPSTGTLAAYPADEDKIQLSTPHIKTFIDDLLVNSSGKDLYIIAHSMGSRGASEAVKNLLLEKPEYNQRIKELIMAAPDINADIYREQIAPFLSDRELPVTVYTASNDRALWASAILHDY